MLSTIESQKVILTDEEETYLAKTSEEEIINIKNCLGRMRNNIVKLDDDGTSVEKYEDLQEKESTYWPTYIDPEKDTLERMGCRQFAEAMSRHITDKNVSLVDIGAGTGYLAVAVKRYGFFDIDCVEPAQDMRDMQPEGLYGKVYLDVISISQPCKIKTGTYDCAMIFGVVNTGHLEVEDFPELLRITKPGGFLVFTLPDFWYKHKDYGTRLDAFFQKSLEKGVLTSIVKERIAYLFRIEDATLYLVKKGPNDNVI